MAVAEEAGHAGQGLELVGQVGRERWRGAGEVAPVEFDGHAGDFPVAALRVLAGGALARRAVGAGETVALVETRGPFAAGQVRGGTQSQAFHVREFQGLAAFGDSAGNVAKGIGTCVAILGGVWRRAKAEGIKQEDKCA